MQTDFSFFGLDPDTLGKEIRDHSYKTVMKEENTDIQRGIVESIIREHNEGITDNEICIMTGICKSSVTARRNEIPFVCAVGIAKYVDKGGVDRFNTLWGIRVRE